jgi:uncharacterized protein (TIGR02118 family)
MIRFSVLYPRQEGARFDADHYRDVHMPMVVAAMGVDGCEIDIGVHGPYVAGAHLTFASMADLQAAMGKVRADPSIEADVANYTDLEPIVQISEVHHSDGH